MMRSRILIMLVAVIMALSVSSCGCLGGSKGGEAKVETTTTTRTTTLGQELQDLDDAHKKGLISDKEYKEKRKELLEREE